MERRNENYCHKFSRFGGDQTFGQEEDDEPEIDLRKHLTDADEVDELFRELSEDEEEVESPYYSSDDETAELLTPAVEKAWWDTFGMIKKHDPKVYEEKTKFFKSDGIEPLVEEEDDEDDEDDENDKQRNNDMRNVNRIKPVYDEEQEALKKSFLAAAEADEDDDQDDDLFQVKNKTAEELAKESEKYRKFLKGEEANCSEAAETVLSGLKNEWSRDDLSEDDKFLKDYILDRKWEGENGYVDVEHPAREVFRDYRYRFQEPDSEFIKSYPKVIEGSMRKVKLSAAARRRRKQDKLEKKAKKKENKELEQRYKLVQSVVNKIRDTGDQAVEKGQPQIPPSFLEEEYDPSTHEQAMKEMLGDDEIDESEFVDDPDALEKPTFEYDPNVDGPMPEGIEQDYEEYAEGWEEDPVQEEVTGTIIEGTRRTKKSRHKKHSKTKLARAKAGLGLPGDSTEPTKALSEYLEAYYDVAAKKLLRDEGRFPYRQVQPDDYGLTSEEIIVAEDKELNAWHDVNEISCYLTPAEEEAARNRYQANPETLLLKKKEIIPSLFEPESPDEERGDQISSDKKASGKNKKPSKKKGKLSKVQESSANLSPNKKRTKLVEDKEMEHYNTLKGVPLSRLKAFGMEEQVLGKKKKETKDNSIPRNEQLKRNVKEAWGETIDEPEPDRKKIRKKIRKKPDKSSSFHCNP